MPRADTGLRGGNLRSSLKERLHKPGFQSWITAILIALVFLATFVRVSLDDLRPSEDNIRLYLAGVAMGDPAGGDALDRQLVAVLDAQEAPPESRIVYATRAVDSGNAMIPSWIMGQVARWSDNRSIDDRRDYGRAVARTFIIATAITAVPIFLLVLGGVVATRRPRLVAAFALTIFLLALLFLLTPGTANPGAAFPIFGFTPRSFLLVATLLVFAWRWRGWWGRAYFLAAATLFLHAGTGVLVIATLLAIDLWFRPELLRRVPIVLAVLGAFGIIAARNPLLPHAPAAAALGLALAVLLVAAWFVAQWRARTWPHFSLPLWPTAGADCMALAVIWLVAASVFFATSRPAIELAIYAPVILFGLTTILVERSWEWIQRWAPAVYGSGLVLTAFVIALAVTPGITAKPFVRGMSELAKRLDQPVSEPLAPAHGAIVSLAMARSIEADSDALTRLLQPFPGFDLRIVRSEPFLERCVGQPRAIVTWLHTWSADMRQIGGEEEFADLSDVCVISPNFNGAAGSSPQTCGSPDSLDRIRLVIEDVRSRHGDLPVVVAGASGGGFHALLLLGTYPGLAQGATIWVPIYDLARWYEERPDHRAELEVCFGGPPADHAEKYAAQSPRTVLSRVRDASVIVNLGKSDRETPPWHARAAYEQMRAACPECRVVLKEWNHGHAYQKDVLEQQVQELLRLHSSGAE